MNKIKLVTYGNACLSWQKRNKHGGPVKKIEFCRNHKVEKRGYRTLLLYF